MARHEDREVVVVEREDGGSALKWLLVGAVLGAGMAMLFAPRTGKELRRDLKGGVRRLRQVATDAIDEFKEELGDDEERSARAMADSGGAYDDEDEDLDEEVDDEAADDEKRRPERPSLRAAREELERRLAAARARRRRPVPDDEEPVA